LTSLLILVLTIVATFVTVNRYHKVGQLDVVTAQAMDMSQMRPPIGPATVEWKDARLADLAPTASFPATIRESTGQSSRLLARASLSPVDLQYAHVGSQAWIAPQLGQEIATSICAIYPPANDSNAAPEVEAAVVNQTHCLQLGQYVTLKIAREASHRRVLIPTAAIVASGNYETIWVARADSAPDSTAPSRSSTVKATIYECPNCHMRFSAEEAAKLHYICSMGDGKLVPVRPPQPPTQTMRDPQTSESLKAHQIVITTGATDGDWSEAVGGDVRAGDHVIVHGFAGLVEGTEVIYSAWTQRGPNTLEAAKIGGVYRCQKCGMVISESDAKRDRFIDPMDGGRIVEDR